MSKETISVGFNEVGSNAITEAKAHLANIVGAAFTALDANYTVSAMYVSLKALVEVVTASGEKRKTLNFAFSWYDSTAATAHTNIENNIETFGTLMTATIARLTRSNPILCKGVMVLTTTYS